LPFVRNTLPLLIRITDENFDSHNSFVYEANSFDYMIIIRFDKNIDYIPHKVPIYSCDLGLQKQTKIRKVLIGKKSDTSFQKKNIINISKITNRREFLKEKQKFNTKNKSRCVSTLFFLSPLTRITNIKII
jgi:hypothetical protein